MPRLRFRLKEVLTEEGLIPHNLEKVLGDKVGRATVYRLARREPSRVDLDTLAWVIWGLRKLTGKPYGVQDLLEYQEEP